MTTKTKPSLKERFMGWLRTDGIEGIPAADLEQIADELVEIVDEDDEAADPDDDGERSAPADWATRTRGMTRQQKRRLAREEAKEEMAKMRSGNYGDVNIVPNPVMTLAREGEEGLSSKRMFQVQMNRGAHSREASRELEWLERSEYQPYNDGCTAFVPFEFLSRYEPMFTKRGRERQARLQETPADRVSASYRAAITSAANIGSGFIPVNVDLDNSLAWLYDRAPVLEHLNVQPGLRSEWKWFYGSNTATQQPSPGPVAEGAAVTESSPRFTELTRKPIVIADQFPISSSLLAMAPATENFTTEGARMLVQERLVREVLSGPNTGAAFVAATNGIASGLLESGTNNDNYGAAATDFGRDDILTVEQGLRDQNPSAGELVWIIGTDLEKLARGTRVGGTDSIRFVAERMMNMIDEGYMNQIAEGTGTHYVATTHLGKSGVTDPGVLLVGKYSVVPIWGDGVEVIVFNDPELAGQRYGFRLHANHVLVNPLNSRGIRRG